jgi:hypothetical protein
MLPNFEKQKGKYRRRNPYAVFKVVIVNQGILKFAITGKES